MQRSPFDNDMPGMEQEEMVRQLRGSGGVTPPGGSPGWTQAPSAPAAATKPGAGVNLGLDASQNDVMANYGAPKMHTGGLRMSTDATRAENDSQFDAMQKHVTQLYDNRKVDGPMRDFASAGGSAQSGGGMAAPAPAPSGLGAFAGKLEGFDAGKLNSDHNSPKYAFGRAMSQFDPKGGISQEMLDALNGLGMGSVSGKIGGDKISIGQGADPRFEGVTEFDIIRDLENGGGFQWAGLNGKAAAPQGAPMGMPQQQGARSMVPTDDGFGQSMQQKIMEILGGPQAFEQEELLRQLGVL